MWNDKYILGAFVKAAGKGILETILPLPITGGFTRVSNKFLGGDFACVLTFAMQ
jgi:hypothetical protein